jgi:metal-sulfur cluster biosynthetic enzyme
MITKEQILEKLKEVQDPEVNVDIVTMGLIYDIKIDIEKNSVHVLMTYTTPFCPFGPQITDEVKEKLTELGFPSDNISVEVTFDPPWKASDELRAALGV